MISRSGATMPRRCGKFTFRNNLLNNMHNKLSIVSRLLVAFASGALIAVFLLPVWRIDLFAPQYPEGLTMNIWINGLSGDVDVINGLNHYIGMKHITREMFPEFDYLPFVVGLFMLLGMIVAITGNRRFLFIYLCLTVVGALLAMYDFYKWGYDYGHNLDPMAPIQVPGLSYQPPLIGHKRLLNFDAYSLPDAGGWIVISAGILAFAVWFVEWYRIYKTKRTIHMRPAITVILSIFLLSSCGSGPEPFNYGKDTCHACKMAIVDPKFGAEVVSDKGKIYKFDDVICLSRFLKSGELDDKDISHNVVVNFEKQNDFLHTKEAYFLTEPGLRSPMGSNTAAFESREAAERFNAGKSSNITVWQELYKKL
jgi:copper chaperone NosL